MTTQEQNDKLDYYLRIYPDTTIKDYLDAVKEIEAIEKAIKIRDRYNIFKQAS